jgi:hypothetical protein
LGHTTGREHHLLSDLEWHIFLIADFSANFIDIREQFPLFPRAECLDIAAEAGITHPVIPQSSVTAVLTSDFVLTKNDSKKTVIVRSAKYARELVKPRVQKNLELEKLYWQRRGIEWRLVTEYDINQVVVKNLMWLMRGAKERAPEPTLKQRFLDELKNVEPSGTLQDALGRVARCLAISSQEACLLFQWLTFYREIPCDISVRMELLAPYSSLRLWASEERTRHVRNA